MLFSTGDALVHLVEWMGPEGVIGTMLGTGFLGAIAKALIDKFVKPKVERDAAEDDAHEKASRMSLALATQLREEVTRMGARVTALEEQVTTERAAREGLQEQVAQQNSALFIVKAFAARAMDYFDDLADRWDVHRLRDAPPTPPRYEQEV